MSTQNKPYHKKSTATTSVITTTSQTVTQLAVSAIITTSAIAAAKATFSSAPEPNTNHTADPVIEAWYNENNTFQYLFTMPVLSTFFSVLCSFSNHWLANIYTISSVLYSTLDEVIDFHQIPYF
ncbi:hypothetical protein DASC09_027380 [Saccharomycopsis crataegensis]|uniref:Uncharacterized protein n=1 Tax=Saccharomycopsis crataegensis TaxID=43959 RepID=A0AAV5QMM0_9ASCO|nr:hypothetical protein DASC09_027380 [Saccharomycopsis crataegensis]